MFTNRALWRTAGALLFALAMFLFFLAIILSPMAFAQDSHAQFWREEAARQGSSAPQVKRSAARGSRQVTGKSRNLGATASAPLLAVASRYVGSRNPTGTRGPWCRDFVNYAIRRAGLPLADNSRKARDAVRLGRRVSQPRPGDLAVMRSHVTIVAGFEAGRVIGLGGNQCGGRVCVSRYAQGRVIAFIRIGA